MRPLSWALYEVTRLRHLQPLYAQEMSPLYRMGETVPTVRMPVPPFH